MKKIFYSYIIISSVLLVSLFTATLIVKYTPTGEVFTNPDKIVDNSYTLFTTEFNFENQQLDQIELLDTYHTNNLIALESQGLFSGAIALYGSNENATNAHHGFLELYNFSNIADEIVPQQMDLYIDTDLINETEYLYADAIGTTADGQVSQPTIYALKNTYPTEYSIDIIDIESNSMSLNSSYIIDSALINGTYGFAVEDVNSDSVNEVYLLGINGTDSTQNVILEFSYNLSTGSFYLSNSLGWSIDNRIIIDTVNYIDIDYMRFIITGIDIGTFETFVRTVSLDLDDVRDFTISTSTTFNFGSDRFRVYSISVIRNTEASIPGLALIGSYLIGGTINSIGCVTTRYVAGSFTTPDLLVLTESNTWSISALICDIDLDQNDEIIQTSYDLLGNAQSNYTVITSNTLEEVNNGSIGLSKIKASAMLYLSDMHIGTFLGKNALNEDTIEFYSTQFVNYQFKSNAEIIVKGESNVFRIESLKLNGDPQNRPDLDFNLQSSTEPLINFTINNLPDNITLDLTSFSYPVEDDTLILRLSKGSLNISEYSIPIEIDDAPSFSIVAPTNIAFKRSDMKSEEFPLVITNNMFDDLTVHINASAKVISQNYTRDLTIAVGSEEKINLPFIFMRSEPEPSYIEEITINIQTNGGVFEYLLLIQIQNKLTVTTTDLLTTLIICAVVVLVILVVLLVTIYGQTRNKIESHLKKQEPLELEFSFFKSQAIKNLASQYIRDENWQVGLLLAETYSPSYTRYFSKLQARDLLAAGQDKLNQGLLQDGLDFWLKARKSLEVIGNHQLIDTLDFQLQPLERIVEAVFAKKADEKAASLQKEFNNLTSMKTQRKNIYGVNIEIPLYLVAVQAGLAYKTTNELETSLNYLQIAYQDAPDDKKNSIVTQITSLIALGVKPTEMAYPIDQKAMQERIAKRETRCFSCGEVMKSNQEKCPNCEMKPVLCSVCKLPVSFGSETAQCPQCENIAHKEHLLEWVKVKGTCPVCQNKLMAKDLKST